MGCTTSLWLHFWELRSHSASYKGLSLSLTFQRLAEINHFVVCVCLVALSPLWVWTGIFHPALCWISLLLGCRVRSQFWVKTPHASVVKNIPSQISFLWHPQQCPESFSFQNQPSLPVPAPYKQITARHVLNWEVLVLSSQAQKWLGDFKLLNSTLRLSFLLFQDEQTQIYNNLSQHLSLMRRERDQLNINRVMTHLPWAWLVTEFYTSCVKDKNIEHENVCLTSWNGTFL